MSLSKCVQLYVYKSQAYCEAKVIFVKQHGIFRRKGLQLQMVPTITTLLLFRSCWLPRFFESLFTAVCCSCQAVFWICFYCTYPWVCAAKKQCQTVSPGTPSVAQTEGLIQPSSPTIPVPGVGTKANHIKGKSFRSGGSVAISNSWLIFPPVLMFL